MKRGKIVKKCVGSAVKMQNGEEPFGESKHSDGGYGHKNSITITV